MGSNPTLSATILEKMNAAVMNEKRAGALIHHSPLRLHHFLLWRGARVVELAALEMLCTGNRTVGSNPTLSVRKIRMKA